MGCEPKYNILIIDDNPFPTRECLCILIEKLCSHFIAPIATKHVLFKTLYNTYFDDDSLLQINYTEIRNKDVTFIFNDKATLTIYNYDPTKSEKINQKNIIKIIKINKINIFWTYRGYSNFRVQEGKMYEVAGDFSAKAKADELYDNPLIIDALKDNDIRQIAMYSYNPNFTLREREELRKKIFGKFDKLLPEDNIYVIETSIILNLFEEEDKLYNGLPETELLGAVHVFNYYGKLLGNILYDLFLQIEENKARLTSEQNRYNYFNPTNRNYLDYLRLLNNKKIDNEEAEKDLKIGLISFIGNYHGGEHFLLDVPYKEYYYQYDRILNNNDEVLPISSIFELKDNNSEGIIYLKYEKIDQNKYNFRHESVNMQNNIVELIPKYLPLLHTAIFYQPDFYELNGGFPYNYFETKISGNLTGGKYCEIFYFIKKYSKNGITGDIHFALWRRKYSSLDYITEAKDVFDYYYPLIEGKAQESIFPLLRSEIYSQATRAAISQVMARNTSHNMGAHVMNKLIGELRELNILNFKEKKNQNYRSTIELEDIHKSVIEKLEKNSWYKDADNQLKIEAKKNEIILEQISIFNNYLKCRMDYLADISFGTPLMQTNKYAYKDLFKELDNVRLLLEHISGLSDFYYEIKFKKNGEELNEDNDLLVAIPNDILGTQAFYNILENIIRNTAKHAKKEPKIDENGESLAITYKFTVNFIDEPENGNAEQNDILKDFIAVEVYDDIDVLGNVTNNQIIEYKNATNEELKSTIDWLVFNQNTKLNDDILQESGSLRSNSLGLIEMDASAAYLRKRDVNKINDVKYDILHDKSWRNRDDYKYFLKAIKKEEKLGDLTKNYLGYRFFLLRPEFVLIVVNDDREISNIDELRKNGITIIKKEDFKEQLQSGKVYNHEFVLHTDMDSETITIDHLEIEILEHYKTSLPIRILKINVDVLKNKLNEKQTLDKNLSNIFEEFCWEEWVKELNSIYGKDGDLYIQKSGDCITKECLCTQNNDLNVIILDHGKRFWKECSYCKKVDYLDDLSTKAYEQLPRLNTKPKENKLGNYLNELSKPVNRLQLSKLCASFMSKILIIDERIQNQINKVYYQEVSDIIEDSYIILNQEVYRKSGIVIPDTYSESPFFKTSKNIEEYKFNLSANDMSEDYGNVLKKYIEYYKDTLKNIDFILIHYSILERICKSGGNDKTKEINRFLESIASLGSPQIVITSGRGTLKGLTSKVRFVNLSPVITSFVEIRSKYYGNYLLNSSRKNNSTN